MLVDNATGLACIRVFLACRGFIAKVFSLVRGGGYLVRLSLIYSLMMVVIPENLGPRCSSMWPDVAVIDLSVSDICLIVAFSP